MTAKKDLYDKLGVKKDASKKDVARAYRKRARETHPDREGSPEEFNEVRKAYAILSDDARRAKYDATGDADESIPDNATAEAMGLLTPMFVGILQAIISSGKDPSKKDILAAMREQLNQHQGALAQRRKEMEVARVKLMEVEKRFTSKKGTVNYLGRVAGDHARQVEQQLKGQALEEAKLAKAFELLDNHKYKFDPEMFTPVGSTATGVYFKWGG